MSDDDDVRVVARFDSEAEAASAARRLTHRGIGSVVGQSGSDDEDDRDGHVGHVGRDDDSGGHCVSVMIGDLARACDILGIEPPATLDEELEARRRRRFPDWVYVLAVFLIALITLPLIAFFVTYKASGG